MIMNDLEQFSFLYRAGEALKLPIYLEEILEQIQKELKAEAGSILLLDPDGKKLEFKVTTGVRSGEIKHLKVDIDEGVAGWVFQNHMPLVVNNTSLDKRFAKRFDESTGFKTRSMLAVPLEVGDSVVGVLELLNKKVGSFSQKDIQDAESAASIASVVIENVELYKHLRLLIAKIRNLENYQKVLLESLTDGVLSIDSENRIVSCNRSFLEMFREIEDSIIGKDISLVFDSDNCVKKIKECCAKKRGIKDLFCYLKLDDNKRIPVAIDVASLRFSEGNKGSVIVVKNLKSALDEAEMKRETLLKSDLLPNLSHELKTPLTAIQAGVDIIKHKLSNNGNKKYVEIIDKNVVRLKEGLQLFLDYLRAEKDDWFVNPEEINLSDFLRSQVEDLQERFPEYHFSLNIPEHAIYISVDKSHIERVFKILFKNAIQYSEVGSEISISVNEKNTKLEVYVEDSGCGISPKNIKYVFDKFRRFAEPLKETRSGLGIGLWLAKYFLKKNNADISLDSKEGKGTVVKLSFQRGLIQ